MVPVLSLSSKLGTQWDKGGGGLMSESGRLISRKKCVSTGRKIPARISETLKSEGTVPTSLSFLLTPAARLRVFQNHCQLGSLVGGLNEQTESDYTFSYSLLQSKSTHWNQPKEETQKAETKKDPNVQTLLLFALWSHGQ